MLDEREEVYVWRWKSSSNWNRGEARGGTIDGEKNFTGLSCSSVGSGPLFAGLLQFSFTPGFVRRFRRLFLRRSPWSLAPL